MRLEQPEPIERQSPGVLRQTGQLVHTRTVCQIMLTDLCHFNLEDYRAGLTAREAIEQQEKSIKTRNT